MYLSEVSLKQFRSYKNAHFKLDEKLTLITGKNGIGKTNLLEAIYILLQGTSFRVADKEMIKTDDRWWRIDGILNGEPRQVRYQLDHLPAKQLVIHDTQKRFMYRDRLPVVLFEPTDLQLVHGSPSRRRDSLDTMLISLSQPYKSALGRYNRALQQRNNALKKITNSLEDQLFSWDILLSEYGVEIINARRDIIDQFNTVIGGYYGLIAGDIQDLKIIYKNDLGTSVSSSRFMTYLHTKLPIDHQRGITSTGPHRDDFEFHLRGIDAKQHASRGEIRTLILALKLSYAELLEKTYNQKPVILLDDVFSELDESRQKNLLSHLSENQIIITDTKKISDGSIRTIFLSD